MKLPVGVRSSTLKFSRYSPKSFIRRISGQKKCFIALGSNMENRLGPIERACKAIDGLESTKVIRTSGLWNTKAMYVTDQNDFLNGVCEVQTNLGPIELLDALQAIENELGRVKLIDKGPRNIDLDILLYEDMTYEHERLQIPHKLMLERNFVLHPLCELIPNAVHPYHSTNFQSFLDALPKGSDTPMLSTFLSSKSAPLTPLAYNRQTQIMSILNFTPDAFSDGGKHSSTDPSPSFPTSFVNSSNIIDIGGQSTNPGAAPLNDDDAEIERILPAIQYASSMCQHKKIYPLISVDTYKSKVAKAALEAGANIINDISAGRFDPDILKVVAQHNDASIILSHSRSTPDTIHDPLNFAYENDDIVAGVANELADSLKAAEAAGIRRWRIVLDPGFGFSKTFRQNVELLKGLPRLRSHHPSLVGIPWVVGLSRKRMVKSLAGDHTNEAKLRSSNAVTLAAAVQGGADIVRVHEPEEARVLTKISDAIWRGIV